ncbi:cofactor FMO1 FAD enzyme [Thozetella sp. PMI_491]|nr:cofactor FMO1 FAD enzyme [Thozetella sp. PMI_491]
MQSEKVDVVVVGAGWSGLIAAKTYLDFVPEANLVIIDNQATLGGTWAQERLYPTLYAQTKLGLFEYSCYPMRNEGITADGYISCKTIHTYLCEFADDFGLARRARLQCSVQKVQRLPAGNGWTLDVSGAKPGTLQCEKLIWAAGAISEPLVPCYPQSAAFSAPIIHSGDTGKHLDTIEKMQSFTVVGGGKSAFDTVFLLLQAGKRVNWVIRDGGSGPLSMMPPTILGLFNSMEVVSTRFMQLFGASIMHTDGLGYRFFHRTRVGRALADAWWKTVNHIAVWSNGYSKSPNADKLRPVSRDNGIFWAASGLGAASVPDYWKVFHAGDCTVHRGEIDSLGDKNTVFLRSGERFQTDTIIMCTGFVKSSRAFGDDLKPLCGLAANPLGSEQEKNWVRLEAEARDTVNELLPVLSRPPPGLDGRALGSKKSSEGPSRHYRRLISPYLAAQGDRSLFFLCLLHTVSTPLVVEMQSLWGVAFMLGLLDVPELADMEREAALWNAWTRKRYPGIGRTHSYAVFDFQSYLDQLLGDLGVRTHRKGSILADMFVPSRPRDYRGVADEFRAVLQMKHLRIEGKLSVDNAGSSPSPMPANGNGNAKSHGK